MPLPSNNRIALSVLRELKQVGKKYPGSQLLVSRPIPQFGERLSKAQVMRELQATRRDGEDGMPWIGARGRTDEWLSQTE